MSVTVNNMLVFLAFVLVYQGFGSSYLITGTNQWGFPQPLSVQQLQNSFYWPHQRTIPYNPILQPYTSQYQDRDYEIRAIKQRQSAIFRLLRCIIENNDLEYCRMLMDHMELFEPDQRKPATIVQPIVIYINTYAEPSRQPSSLPKQPDEPIPTKMPGVKFPEKSTSLASSPVPITTNPTTEAPMVSHTNEETTTEPYTHSHASSSAKLNTKEEEAITEITKEHIESTTLLDSFVFVENAEENNESHK